MGDPGQGEGRLMARITCFVHQRLAPAVGDRLIAAGAHTVLAEKARGVRQRVRAASRWWPGGGVALDDSPMEIFRASVPTEAAEGLMGDLSRAADLESPGRGALYVQDVTEYGPLTEPPFAAGPGAPGRLLRDLSLVTVLVSKAGSGERIARIALGLGACVPVVGLGEGTGIRDRLGLLRITIPPEKEIVHLMVPRHDASGIERLLIEEARMDRPGGGFLYRTPIRSGMVDPMLRIGRQDRAASLEQIIAAVDELKAGTAWRKRYAEPGDPSGPAGLAARAAYREIVFLCTEGRAAGPTRAAMEAGAGGVTLSRVRCLGPSDREGGIAARERGVLCVPAALADRVRAALVSQDNLHVQVLEAPFVFSHQRPS